MYQSVHSISSTVIVAAAMMLMSDIRNRQVGSLGLLWPWNGYRLKTAKNRVLRDMAPFLIPYHV